MSWSITCNFLKPNRFHRRGRFVLASRKSLQNVGTCSIAYFADTKVQARKKFEQQVRSIRECGRIYECK